MNSVAKSPISNTVPVVSLASWRNGNTTAQQSLAKRVSSICHTSGFFYLSDHGISQSFVEQYLNQLKAFFELPESIKQSIDKIHSPQFRGWEKLGSELTNNTVDYREQLDIGPERLAIQKPNPYYLRLVGPNQWPDEKILPEFQQCVLEFLSKLTEVAQSVLSLMSVSLGLESNHFLITPKLQPCSGGVEA